MPCGAGGQPLLPDAERWGENRLGTSSARHACWQTPAPLREVLAFYRRALPITTPAGPATLGSGQGASTSRSGAGRAPTVDLADDPRPPGARGAGAPYGGGLDGRGLLPEGRSRAPRRGASPRGRGHGLAQARGLPGGADEAHAELARRLRTDPPAARLGAASG